VYDLLAAPFSAAQADGVTDKQREVVEAITKLKVSHPDGASLGALAVHLDVSKSAVNQRLRNLLVNGYVRNLSAGQKGVPARYEVGDPLPPREENLPTLEAVREAIAQQGSQEGDEWLPI
jgi:DNA-binding IclR family transcriptional regulator